MQHPIKQKIDAELKKDHLNFYWFYLKFLQSDVTDLAYTTIMNQLKGHYPLNEKVEKVIENYIEEQKRLNTPESNNN